MHLYLVGFRGVILEVLIFLYHPYSALWDIKEKSFKKQKKWQKEFIPYLNLNGIRVWQSDIKSSPPLDLIFDVEFYETPKLLWQSEKILIQSLDILTFVFSSLT